MKVFTIIIVIKLHIILDSQCVKNIVPYRTNFFIV